MGKAAIGIRRSLGRALARVGRPRARTLLPLGGTLALVVALSLAGSQGSYALLNSQVVVNAGAVNSASLSTTVSGTSSLGTGYSGASLSATGSLTIANTGTAPGSYSTAVTLGSGTSSALAARIALVAWAATDAGCVASATPVAAVSGTLAAPPALIGTLQAHGSVVYCLRTTLTSTTGLTSGSTASATVTATTRVGGWSSIASTSFTQKFIDTVAPSIPSGLTASDTTTTATGLSWAASTDNVGVTAYTVYRNGTSLGTVAAPVTSFTDSALTPATSYSYTVRATDAVGNASALSSPLVVTTAAIVTTPPVDTNLWYQLVNVKNSACVIAKESAPSAGSAIFQTNKNSCQALGTSNESWLFTAATTTGYYTVSNGAGTPSLIWSVAGATGDATNANGAPVQLQTRTGAASQQWKPMKVGATGYFQFANLGSAKCLVATSPSGYGAAMQQQPCDPTDAAQLFSLNTTGITGGAIATAPPSGATQLLCSGSSGDVVMSFAPPSTPSGATTYAVTANGVATSASLNDWSTSVHLNSETMPAGSFPSGSYTIVITRIPASGTPTIMGYGTVVVGMPGNRTYNCG